MALTGDDNERLDQLCQKTYKEQAIWFLNAMWGDFDDQKKENVWNYAHKFGEFDLAKKAEGNELDELNAHRFLESFHMTLTVREMRDKLRSKGALKGTIEKKVPLTHFLVVHFDSDWHYVVHAPQGDNKAEIEEAQRKLDAVMEAFRQSEARANEAKEAVKVAKARERDAQNREAEAKQREAESIQAQKELEAALAEVKRQEDAYNRRTEELKQRSEEGGVVSRNKAKNELAQHLTEDPLPLRKAKITAEAAVRAAEKAAAAAAEAVKVAQEARHVAEEATQNSLAAQRAAEDAVEEARRLVEEAEQFLEKIKNRPGQGQGTLWWMSRELHEKKKFLPLSKGGIARS